MGRKGQSTALKRKPAPRFWPLHKKEFTFAVKPLPGPHETEKCLPLALILRDVLKLAKTRKEAKTIVNQGKIRVDGRIRRKDDFPVGLLDVVSVPDITKNFNVLPSYRGLKVNEISNEEAKFKLCRIEDKTILDDGQVQLHLHDGTNILVKVADPKNPTEDIYDTLDTVKISIPEKEILDRIEMKAKAYALITGGKNEGKHGRIVEIEDTEGKKRRQTLVTIKDPSDSQFQTILDFVFVIGETQPLVNLGEKTVV